jgi:glucose-1-phosphate thymidylyltransferase
MSNIGPMGKIGPMNHIGVARDVPAVSQDIVGLIPAAGQASRIAPLPCSKELYPVGFRTVNPTSVRDQDKRPKVVCHYLLEKIQLAGATKTYIVLRDGKWDIPAYLGDGTILGDAPAMHLAYLMMRLPFGAPYTIDQAYPFVKDAQILFGFPDILFQPQDAFARLLEHQSATGADVVLGLFSSDQPHKMDMVDLAPEECPPMNCAGRGGRVRKIVIKPRQTDLQHAWIIATWTPVFTRFMHEHLATIGDDQARNQEVYVGHIIQAAIDSGLQVEAELFARGTYLDIGTPKDLARAHSGAFDQSGCLA